MTESSDRTTVRVSTRAQDVLTRLTSGDAALFRTELAAYLAAAALAVRKGLDPVEQSEIAGQTKWNRGSGAIGQWELLTTVFLDTAEPIAALMGHAEAGLRFLEDRIDRGRTPSEIFSAS
jgi:hypothetical protein